MLDRLKRELRDTSHPKGSPLLGRLISVWVCRPFGHAIGIYDYEHWDEPWFACPTCGARWGPAGSIVDEDGELTDDAPDIVQIP